MLPPVASFFYGLNDQNPSDNRQHLSIYKDHPWVFSFYREYYELRTSYQESITWRRHDYSGETINISEGIRRSSVPLKDRNDREFWFFGGSTMWGFGVDDENTIPSAFVRKYGQRVVNFGEAGYTARQSMAMLTNYLVTKARSAAGSKISIMFFDGVNDVAYGCEVNGNARTLQIRRLIEESQSVHAFSLAATFKQLLIFFQKVLARINPPSTEFDCSTDSKKALKIAQNLVNTWIVAERLSSSMGFPFVAVLQPVAFIGKPNLDHLGADTVNTSKLAPEYRAVYPLIRLKAKAAGINFIDISDAYDGHEHLYLDFCHVGPNAHSELMEKLDLRLPPHWFSSAENATKLELISGISELGESFPHAP